MPYREKDEDDDLEKAYKEVGVWCLICRPCWIIYQRREAFIIDRSQYLDFLRLILAICCLVKGFTLKKEPPPYGQRHGWIPRKLEVCTVIEEFKAMYWM